MADRFVTPSGVGVVRRVVQLTSNEANRDTANASGATRIECRSVGKVFRHSRTNDEIVALQDFNLLVTSEEIITLLGPSGCGKSTLLNLIAGFEKPTSGQISIGGHVVENPGPDRGMVFQDHALFPWLTVEDNIAFGLKAQGMPSEQRAKVAKEYIDLIGLQNFEDRYPHELSGGMKQRVGIARVLAIQPQMLLMDEPFGALDAQTRALLQKELLRVWERDKRPIIFVTHNVEEAVFLGDRVVVMTARPGTVKEVIEVDLPRPRNVAGDDFNYFRRLAMLSIEDEVNRSMALGDISPGPTRGQGQ